MTSRWAWVATLFIGPAVAVLVAQDSLVLLDTPLLVVDQAGTATATLTLRNGSTKTDLRLNLSEFECNQPDRKKCPETIRILTPAGDKDKSILDSGSLAPNASINLKATVSRLWRPGRWTAKLRNGQDEAGALTAIAIPPAYNIQIVSSTPDSPEIQFRARKALVTLQNSDPFHYRFTWKLHVRGQLLDPGKKEVDLPGNSTTYLDLSPAAPPAGPLTAGTLKAETLQGKLILQPAFADEAPAKELPATFRVSYWSEPWQTRINGLFLLVLLAMGGFTSIWVNYGLPNTSRALALKRRLRDLENKVEGLYHEIDCRWRVLLEFHLSSARTELSSTPWLFPSFATTLTGVTTKVDVLQEWVGVAYGVSMVLDRATRADQKVQDGVPPTVMCWIKERCARALSPIETGFTTSEEITAMKADLKAAENYLELTLAGNPNPDLEKEIQDRESRLKPALDNLNNYFKDEFAGLIQQVKENVNTAAPLKPVSYSGRDICSFKADLLRQYLDLHNRAPAAAASRLRDHRGRLIEYLGPDTQESLWLAGVFIREMGQDIYPDGTPTTELKREPPALVISAQPNVPKAGMPVLLVLRFEREILNEAAARQEWKCSWDFGDRSAPESGWEVHHSFSRGGTYPIQVSISNIDGEKITQESILTKLIVQESDTQLRVHHRAWKFLQPSPETKLELAKLLLVLAPVTFGLMASAWQKIQSLDLFTAVVTVFGLGFGADTLKNLVTQRPAGS